MREASVSVKLPARVVTHLDALTLRIVAFRESQPGWWPTLTKGEVVQLALRALEREVELDEEKAVSQTGFMNVAPPGSPPIMRPAKRVIDPAGPPARDQRAQEKELQDLASKNPGKWFGAELVEHRPIAGKPKRKGGDPFPDVRQPRKAKVKR